MYVMNEKKEAYAHLAKWFEYLNDDCGYEGWFSYLLGKLSPYSLQEGLDVGCGGGWFTRAFQRAGYTMTGMDSSLEMLDYAQEQAFKEGVNPVEKGSFCVGWVWRKNKKTGKTALSCDPNHLNSRGRYLQACVWYGFVFKKSPLEIKYDGKLSPADAAFLRQCADKALKSDTFKK